MMRPLDGEGATEVLLMGHRRLRITGMVCFYSLARVLHLRLCIIYADYSSYFFSPCIDCVVNVLLI